MQVSLENPLLWLYAKPLPSHLCMQKLWKGQSVTLNTIK